MRFCVLDSLIKIQKYEEKQGSAVTPISWVCFVPVDTRLWWREDDGQIKKIRVSCFSHEAAYRVSSFFCLCVLRVFTSPLGEGPPWLSALPSCFYGSLAESSSHCLKTRPHLTHLLLLPASLHLSIATFPPFFAYYHRSFDFCHCPWCTVVYHLISHRLFLSPFFRFFFASCQPPLPTPTVYPPLLSLELFCFSCHQLSFFLFSCLSKETSWENKKQHELKTIECIRIFRHVCLTAFCPDIQDVKVWKPQVAG